MSFCIINNALFGFFGYYLNVYHKLYNPQSWLGPPSTINLATINQSTNSVAPVVGHVQFVCACSAEIRLDSY